MNIKNIFNAVYIFKTYIQSPNIISKPDKCYSLIKLISNPYYFDDDIMPILDCTCSYTCRYKHGKLITNQPKKNYDVIHLHE